jgi:acetyl esterase/lipase
VVPRQLLGLALLLAALMAQPAPASASAGVVVVLHGGGWMATGPGAVAHMRPAVRRFESYGWKVVNADYRPQEHAYEDVQTVFDATTAAHRGRPVCIYGESAGGQLALMLAVRRSPACVIAAGAPTDLDALAGAPRDWATWAFGGIGGLTEWSPAAPANAALITAPLLLAHAAGDPVIPHSQLRAMRRARPTGTTTLTLHPGRIPWVHARVTRRSLNRFRTAEQALLTRVRSCTATKGSGLAPPHAPPPRACSAGG